MAVRDVYVAGGNGIGYTKEVDSSADYGSVSNDTYFKDLSLGVGGLIMYKIGGIVYPIFATNSIPQSGVFKANISQRDPDTRTNDELPLGTIWTITTYKPGDDFSNMEMIVASTFSNTINGTGSVLRAINGYDEWNTQPTVWSNGSVLNYDGRPYYTSIDSNGNYGPFYNTFNQDFNFSYVSTGVYRISSTGSFVPGKHSFLLTNHSGGMDMTRSIRLNDNSYTILCNEIGNQIVSVDGTTFSTGNITFPISYTASFSFVNKDTVLQDASILIEKWL